MSEYTIKFDERETEVLTRLAAKKEMSVEALVRHFTRMGQFVDHYITQDYKLLFRPKGKTEPFDPFDMGPKAAPMPTVDGHIDCPCWASGSYSRVEGCPQHPYDL